MKNVIVFGATGNVGSYFVKYAVENLDMSAYTIIPSGRRRNVSVFRDISGSGVNPLRYISADITKIEEFNKLPSDDVYAVVHLASVIPAYMDGYHPKDYLDSVIQGTYNVLEYCRKVHADRILFSTSCYDVWNYPTGTVIRPDMPLNYSYSGDHAMYVICKNTAVELLRHYNCQYGLKVFIFRFPTIYSYSPNHYIYPNGVKTLRPLYKCIFRAMKGEPLEIWGDPQYAKDMTYVYDMSQMFCKAIEVQGIHYGFYNCGTGVPVTLMEQMTAIRDVFSPVEKPSEIVCLSDKIAGGGLLMDVQNAKDELGYSPVYDVRRMFEDYKKEMIINRFAELRT